MYYKKYFESIENIKYQQPRMPAKEKNWIRIPYKNLFLNQILQNYTGVVKMETL